MFLNLISRVVERAVESIVGLVNTGEVTDRAVEALIADGIDYGTLAEEIDTSEVACNIELDYRELAGEIDVSDIASELDRGEIAAEIIEDYRFRDRMDDMVREVVGERVTALEEKVQRLSEAKAAEPTPDEAQTVSVPAALTDRLLALAVERLLAAADEAARDGKV
jgi:hypothetical protein